MRRIFKFLAALSGGASINSAWFFSAWYLSGSIEVFKKIEVKKGHISHKQSSQKVSLKQAGLFWPRADWLSWVLQNFSVENDTDHIIVHAEILNKKIRFPLRNLFDVSVFCELLQARIYSWVPNKECIMLDFGCNTGLTSIYCGANDLFSKIYAYELVTSTFEIATKNIMLNTVLSDKITLVNKALGNSRKFVSTNMFSAGSVTASLQSSLAGSVSDVEVIVASEEVDRIALLHPGHDLFLKMDIEGAELEVIENLHASGSLVPVLCIIMECHCGNQDLIIPILSTAGFAHWLIPLQEESGNMLLFAQRT